MRDERLVREHGKRGRDRGGWQRRERRGDGNLLAIPLGHRVVNGPLAPVATAAVVWLFGLNYAHFCIAFARLSYS